MKLHQQFDVNLKVINYVGREFLLIPPQVVEQLIRSLTQKGYIVLKSSAQHIGIPQSITLIKDITSPRFAVKLSTQAKDDFNAISKALGIGELFE